MHKHARAIIEARDAGEKFVDIARRFYLNPVRCRYIYMGTKRRELFLTGFSKAWTRLPNRVVNSLVRGNYRDDKSIIEATDTELLKLRNFGVTSLAEVRKEFPRG